MNFLFFTIIALVIGIIADLISNGFVAIVAAIIAHFILLVLYMFLK